MVYDPRGRLFQVSTSSTLTQFLYDGDALVAEYDANGVVAERYVHGNGADLPLVWYHGSGLTDRRWLHADHQGSIIAISDGAGTMLAINRYDEYGIPGSGNVGRFQYTGQIWLSEIGVYHYKARAYSPTLGRMMQTDPVGYQDQFNLYAYVGNDPVNLTDPSGMAICGSCSGYSYEVGMVNLAAERRRGAQQGTSSSSNARGPQGERILSALRRDPEVTAAMFRAWRESGGDGPTGGKNERGFWLEEVGSDFRIGRMLYGDGGSIDRRQIDNAHAEMPNASIFFHTHPYRIGEVPGARSLGFSPGDRRIASYHRALIVAVARPEPYRGPGHGWLFMYDDGFYLPPPRR